MKNILITKPRLKNLISKFPSSSIMVVGDVMLDEYWWGDVRRISPEAPVPVLEVESSTVRLGGAANVVQNLIKLTSKPRVVSVIGRDKTGERLKQILTDMHCPVDGLYASISRPTTIKTRMMARNQQIVRADRELRADLTPAERSFLMEYAKKTLAKVDGVIISDYSKGVISQPFIGELIAECKKRKLFVAVDPKERHFELYQGVSVITPNLKEAHQCLGVPYKSHCTDDEVRAMGWKIIEQLNLECLLITLSERGMALFEQKSHTCTHLPTVARHVYDVTGAGDTVISVYSTAITCGAKPVEAAFLANHAAGITVAELGTASVDPQTLLKECLESLKV